MKFTVSTEPLKVALDLGIVNSNISKFNQKSNVAELTADGNLLRVNVETSRIKTELTLKGSNPEGGTSSIIVDCSLLKQLVNTFETSQTSLDFTKDGLVLQSGSAKFTLPRMLDAEDELNMNRPEDVENSMMMDVDKEGWKFVKDHQMYAIAVSQIHAVYTRVWVGEDGTVLVGDFDNSIFTKSQGSKLGSTCLLSDTIINLFTTLPDGAKMAKKDDSYVIKAVTDGYTFLSQFIPFYESSPDVGSYNSEIVLSTMDISQISESECISVCPDPVIKFLRQADLLLTGSDSVITMDVGDNQLIFRDKNIDCRTDIMNPGDHLRYTLTFKMSLLRPAFANYMDEDVIDIYPHVAEGEVVGIIIHSASLSTVLAGVDE